MTNRELIEQAASVVNSKQVGEFMAGNVGAAVLSNQNNLYLGVCIVTGSSMGFCAEHNAVGAMITAQEYKISKVVAVWKDDNGQVFVIPPCGRCREFMRQIDPANLETEVILDLDKTVRLKDLLPYYDWWQKIQF